MDRRFVSYAFGAMMALPLVSPAADRWNEPATIPHAGEAGREGFRAYLEGGKHRAFAIAPGGAWAWEGGAPSAAVAEERALRACREHTEQKCVTYAVDDRRVFDAQAWARSWRPYVGADEAASAAVGTARGMRFPDLAFRTADGSPSTLKDFRGKVAVVHFWASWCGPCRRELPDMARVAKRLARDGVAFVPLQVRESFATSRSWAGKVAPDLRLLDSGAQGAEDGVLRLADGGKVADRSLAKVFPTSYVLDRNGVVLFSHHGPIADWEQYVPFLLDAAGRAGK